MLPGSVGHAYREAAAREMCRKFGKKYEEVVVITNNSLPPVSAKELIEIYTALFAIAEIDKTRVVDFIRGQVAKAEPRLKPYMDAAAPLLVTKQEDEAVTVTVLAKMYVERTGKSLSKNNTDHGNAIGLNKLLIERGLQKENPNPKAKKDGQPTYLPTDEGKKYGQVIFQQGNSSSKTVQQLRWYPSVIDFLG